MIKRPSSNSLRSTVRSSDEFTLETVRLAEAIGDNRPATRALRDQVQSAQPLASGILLGQLDVSVFMLEGATVIHLTSNWL